MSLPTLIDVAIGLVLVFFLLATIGSLLAEMWAAHQKIRHSLLRKTVEKLLERDSARKFWAHSLIEPLVGTARIKPRQTVPPASTATAPAAATPPAVAVAATGTTRKKDGGGFLFAPYRWFKRLVKKITAFLRPREAEAPGYLDANLFAAVVLDIASGQGAAGRVPNTLGAWRQVIVDHVPAKPGENNDLQDRLLTLLRQVPVDTADVAAALKAAVAKWYDQAMERASSVYRRQTQRSLLVIGALLALALNVDAVRIVQVLYLNPNLREQIAQQGIQTYTEQVDENGKPKAPPADQSNREELKGYVGDLRNMVKAGFPLGWLPEWQANFIHLPDSDKLGATSPTPPESAATDQGLLASVGEFFAATGHAIASFWHTFTSPGWLALFAKVCGLAASAFAVCLGAPFWFDLLGRLVKLRSSAGADAEKKKDSPADAKGPAPGGSGTAGAASVVPGAPPPPPAPLPSALDALASPGTAFEVARASWLAEFADRAYETDTPTLTRWLDENGFKLVKSFDAQGTQGYLATSANSAVLAFRGTEKKLEDWVSDARFDLVDGKAVAVDGQVHQGFSDALLLISAAVDRELDLLADRRVLLHVTGHSLGAALATLAALHCASRAKTKELIHTVHTFGSPRVGDPVFVAAYENKFRGRTYRVVNNEDLVTRVPPRLFPLSADRILHYDHVGEMIYIDEAGKLQRDVGYWFRFLNFVTNALGDLKEAVKTTVKDHSMQFYCGFLKKAAQAPRPQP